MMDSYQATHGTWNVIPFESDDRDGLKQKFGICAMSEAMTLGLASGGKRKFGIPTLVLVDCESEEVKSFDGVADLVSGDAFQKWGLDN
jgi:hypothetical protein